VILAGLAMLAQLVLPVPRPDSVPRAPAIVTRAPLDTLAPVNFRVLVSPDTVYVGQEARYELGVFLDGSIRDRLRRMEAIAPEMRGMMAYDPPAPATGFPMRIVGSHRYEAHVYQRAIFPLTAGRFAIPPARLVYAMPLSYSFFSREENYEIRSDSAIVIAIDPPRAARPPDWLGAVGTLQVSARIDTAGARVGDPVLFTLTIAGHGNIKLLPRPRLSVPWAAAVEAGERVTLAPDSLDIRGVKEFDWVLTPLHAGRMVLPAIRYPYFDPEEQRYEVPATAPLSLDVAPGALATLDTGAPARPRWPVRTVYRGALTRAPYDARPFWWVIVFVPLPALALLVAHRPRRRRAPPSAARVLHALARQPAPPGAREIRRAFLSATSERVRLPALLLAEPHLLERAARRAGTSTATATAAAELLEELNAAAFSPTASPARDLAERAERVYRAIDTEARRFRTRGASASRRAIGIGLLLVGLGTTARAIAPDPNAAQFARGVEAYDHGRFAIAARDFAAVAWRVPRAADAWANLGTAAFAANDTARAMLGWQRALRLEPLAGDVRDRLEVLGSAASSGPAGVPRVPPVPLALGAALLWIGGWLLLAWSLRRRRTREAGALVAACLGVALALGAAAASIDARLAARDLVVLAHDAPLRLLPALGSEQRSTARTGEIARVTERDGHWAHVITEAGRDGWMDADSLYSIARAR
jgi:hypothetical protein